MINIEHQKFSKTVEYWLKNYYNLLLSDILSL